MKPLIPILLLLAGFSFISCDGDSSAAPLPTGTLWGRVSLADEFGQDIADSSGVTVSIRGTSLTGTSNAQGVWRIEGVPPGVYDIAVTKADFGEARFSNVQFGGYGSLYVGETYVNRLPDFSVTSFYVLPANDGPGSFYASGRISEPIPAEKVGTIKLFFRNDSVGPFSAEASQSFTYGYVYTGSDTFNMLIMLPGFDLPGPQRYHVQAVPSSKGETTIWDINKNILIHTAINAAGASQPVTVEVP